ncbi:MAG: exodeoxyribonuclease VII small subunit [Erysipelotrichaceae bacterium]|nr:exodeoxyribonuclease VII small subunit [Lachnospiraceae bacterium]MBR4122501.1 exodeoxyribonuclease VII small subunit [Erysipelotrichaceae bacterium]
MKDGLTLEEAFDRLDDIVKQLESENISLEDAFRDYKDGMDLLKYCNDSIDAVEKNVLKLNEEGETDAF